MSLKQMTFSVMNTGRGGVCKMAQGAEHRAQGKEHRAQSAGQRTQSKERRAMRFSEYCAPCLILLSLSPEP